jgi:hypothetical protein
VIFINVWVGASLFYSKNRAHVGGITRESLHKQTCEIIDYLNRYHNNSIPYPSELEVLPTRTQNPKNKQLVDDFIAKLKAKYSKIILIANNHVESSQTPQFNFGSILENVMANHQDTAFVYTANSSTHQSLNDSVYFESNQTNYFIFDDVCPIPNLSEIDYFSECCDILVTRMSGPGIIFITNDTYLDPKKTVVSFTTNPYIAFEALSSDEEIANRSWGINGGAKLKWCSDITNDGISNVINTTLNEIN